MGDKVSVKKRNDSLRMTQRSEREKRLAAALRSNLKRRKAAARLGKSERASDREDSEERS